MRNVAVSLICRLLIAITGVAAFESHAWGQLPSTRLSALFPTGARSGSTVEVTVTSGLELEDLSKLVFNHAGITAVQKTQTVGGIQTPVPNVFLVTVAPNVPPGQYEVRTIGFYGISNPRFFVVGSLSEINETEPNNVREQANSIEINQTINGRINGGSDVDWFKLMGKKGQRLFVNCMAKRLDSRLDSALELYNIAGKRLDFVRRNLDSQDTMLDISIPSDGEYFIKLYDFTYAGGEEYPYRLTFTTAPHIDFVLPASGIPDSNAQYTLFGRNLPGGKPAGIFSHGHPLEKLTVNIALPPSIDLLDAKVELKPFSAGIDATSFSIESPVGRSNVVLIQLGKFVPVLEVEPNDKGSQAQKLVVPIEINGQFQTKGDVDCFQFDAASKDVYWIEILAHRAGSAIDPYMVIDQVKTNDKGEESLTRITTLDDDANNPLANLFDTLNDDGTVKFVAPADGTYRITLRERSNNARQDLGVYRLIIRKESPDFRVAAVATTLIAPGPRQAAPSGINLRRGDNFPVNVAAFRRDGFEGPITISAEGLPPGVTCHDIVIGNAPSSGVIVFTSTEDAPAWAGTIQLVAKARIDDPFAVQAWTLAESQAKTDFDVLAASEKMLLKMNEDRGKANEVLTAAKNELMLKPEDVIVQQKVTDCEIKLAAAITAQKVAMESHATAARKAQETRAKANDALQFRNSAAREVTHPVRYGTVRWGAALPNVPTEARVAQAIELSVMEEASPYQLTTDLYRIEANHNRQILIPVKVVRRNGFDQPVNLTFVGQPPNVQIENKPIAKEKTDEFLRFFVPPNVPVGTYVTYLTGQAAVSYRKNPAKADKAKAELDAIDKIVNVATVALKSATDERDATARKFTDDAASLKKLLEVKQQSEKNLADAQNFEKLALEAAKNTGDDVEAKSSAEKKLTEAQASTKSATDALAAVEKAYSETSIVLKRAEDAKVKSEAEFKTAEDKHKATAAERTIIEQRFKTADAYAKAANINFFPTTTPIIVTVKPAPLTLTATPREGGTLKIGAKIEVQCEVKRQNGFEGPITLSLPLPPNVTGLRSEPLTIAADQSMGTLIIEAAADSAETQFANMVVRAVCAWDGEAIVDQPITLKTSK